MTSPRPSYPRAEAVHAYARDVVEGRVVAGQLVRAACRRHLEDLTAGPLRGLVWRPEKAEGALRFFDEILFLSEGVPFRLQPFQVFIVGSIHGWWREDQASPTGLRRRFRFLYAEVGKANGKTPLGAGLGLYAMVVDEDTAPEIYSAASAHDQAAICFNDAKRMVEASPALRKSVTVLTNCLTVPVRYARFAAISAEHRTHHGKRVSCAILDEIHAHQSAAVVRAVVAGTKSRRNALIVLITNSGSDRASVCWEYHDLAHRVLLGGMEKDDLFAYVCGLDPCPKCAAQGHRQPDLKCPHCDDYRKPETWPKANPGLGTICLRSYVAERVELATKMPSEANDVLQLNFCRWTESASGWADMHQWHSVCRNPELRMEDFAGRPCWVAIDAANKVDLSAMVVLFERDPGMGRVAIPASAHPAKPLPEDPAAQLVLDETADGERLAAAGGYVAFARFFLPERTVANARHANHDLYRQWQAAERLIVTDGARMDFARMEEELRKVAAAHQVRRLSFDPREMSYLVQQVSTWADFEIVEVNQSPAMISQPMKELEALIASGAIRHDGDPVLAWCMANVVQRAARGKGTAKYYFPAKPTEASKIDGVVALIMAIDSAIRAPAEQSGEPFVVGGL